MKHNARSVGHRKGNKFKLKGYSMKESDFQKTFGQDIKENSIQHYPDTITIRKQLIHDLLGRILGQYMRLQKELNRLRNEKRSGRFGTSFGQEREKDSGLEWCLIREKSVYECCYEDIIETFSSVLSVEERKDLYSQLWEQKEKSYEV
jgi:hypothetical protein